MVYAWTSKPTKLVLFIDRLLSHVALRFDLPIHSVTHVLRIGVGHSILAKNRIETADPVPGQICRGGLCLRSLPSILRWTTNGEVQRTGLACPEAWSKARSGLVPPREDDPGPQGLL